MSGATLDMVQKKPTKNKETDIEPVDKHTMAERAIKKFVGRVENLHDISISSVCNDNYRVNVWVFTRRPDHVCDKYSIIQSYFMKFSDGTLTDLTIEPKEDLKPW